MVDEGFDKEFSASIFIPSSTVGPIIPPSIPAVVYAMVANVSVGKLLIAGLVPGILMGVLVMMVFCTFISVRRHYPKHPRQPLKLMLRDLLFSFFNSILPMLAPVILLAGIYSGVVTTTEASGLAIITLILGVILYRTMNLKSFVESIKSVFKVSAAPTLLVIPSSKVFSFVMTRKTFKPRSITLSSALREIPARSSSCALWCCFWCWAACPTPMSTSCFSCLWCYRLSPRLALIPFMRA